METVRARVVVKTLGATVAAVSLGLAGYALAAPEKDTYNLTANLKPRFEVPRPTGVPSGATGLFTGKAVELANDRVRLTWRMTFSKLSGRAVAAHIHLGKRGKAGSVVVALCGPCRSGQRGTATTTHARLRAMRAGGTYVNVHTARNAAGEIRGQVKASEASERTSSDSDTTPPATTTEPPYP